MKIAWFLIGALSTLVCLKFFTYCKKNGYGVKKVIKDSEKSDTSEIELKEDYFGYYDWIFDDSEIDTVLSDGTKVLKLKDKNYVEFKSVKGGICYISDGRYHGCYFTCGYSIVFKKDGVEKYYFKVSEIPERIRKWVVISAECYKKLKLIKQEEKEKKENDMLDEAF